MCPPHRMVPRWLLPERFRRFRPTHGVLRGERVVSDLQPRPGQRPLQAGAGPFLSRPQPGDHWCVCAARWLEAYEDGMAPRVRLESSALATLQVIPLEVLRSHAA